MTIDGKTYCCSYRKNGKRFSFDVSANTWKEAERKASDMGGNLDGKLIMREEGT